MNRIHRSLFLELLRGGFWTLLTLLSIWFLVALALLVGSSRAAGAPFLVLLRFTAFEAIATLWLTLPLAMLTAALFVYGRARADRETTAMTVAGLSPLQMLTPALAFGALGALALGWLQTEVMPAAKFESRRSHDSGIGAHLDTLLRRSQRSIVEEGWSARWERLVERDGVLELEGLHLLVLDDERKVRQSIEAERAIPAVDRDAGILTLDLEGAVVRPEGARPVLADRLRWPLDLKDLGRDFRQKRINYQSTAEVLVSKARAERLANRPDVPAEVRSTASRVRREAALEFHARIAHAGSAFFCALFGGILGLRFGTRNRAIVFLIGFLCLAVVHHPLGMLGESLAKSGRLPEWLARWLGSLALFLLSMASWRRLLRA